MFKIKDGHKLEVETPETMKLFGSAEKVNKQKKKNRTNLQSLEVVQVVLIH